MARPRSPRAGDGSRRRDRDNIYRDDQRDNRRRYDERGSRDPYDNYRPSGREDDTYRPPRRSQSPRRRDPSPRRRPRSPHGGRVRDRDHRRDDRDRAYDRRPERPHERSPAQQVTEEHSPPPELPQVNSVQTSDPARDSKKDASQQPTQRESAAQAQERQLRLQRVAERFQSASNLPSATPTPSTPSTSTNSQTLPALSANAAPTRKPGFKSISSLESSGSASVQPASAIPARIIGKIGLKMSAADSGSKKRSNVNLGEEEVKRRKLEQLPDEPSTVNAELNGDAEEEDEEDDDMTLQPTAVDTAEGDEPDSLDVFMAKLEAEMDAENGQSKDAKGELYENTDEVAFEENEESGELLETITDQINEIKGLKKKKDVPVINWSTVELTPFEKTFYKESADIQNLSPEEISAILARDNITIRGKNPLRPILRWENASFPMNIMTVIENELGFPAPTAIQAIALPTLMSGRDLIGIAQTGSGKTLAYVLPMLRHISAQPLPSKLESQAPAALILVPTRELATQVHTNARPFTKKMNLRMIAAYGGAVISEQISLIKAGVDILICTPGRAIELLQIRKLDLHRVTFFVLDEADRMLDMGFEPQISKIAANVRPDRQICCFSATFNKKMDSIARTYLRNPIEITVAGKSTIPKGVSVEVFVIPEEKKFYSLLKILGEFSLEDDDPRTLIFVNQQKTADDLLNKLLKHGYPCNSIYGSKDQQDRTDAIADFSSGAVPVLIGTSVAARGLDIEQLKLVVEYDPADHMEDNIHRIGRTGRAGKTGRAVCFISPAQANCAEPLAKALRISKREVPKELQDLVDEFEEQVKTGKAQRGGSGFGGRGLEKLDQEHNSERRTLRIDAGVEEASHDMLDTSDNEDEMTKAIWAKATGQQQQQQQQQQQPEESSFAEEARARLKQFDNIQIDIKKREVPTDSTAPMSYGGADGLSKAQLAAANISARLSSKNTIRSGQSLDNKGRKYFPFIFVLLYHACRNLFY